MASKSPTLGKGNGGKVPQAATAPPAEGTQAEQVQASQAMAAEATLPTYIMGEPAPKTLIEKIKKAGPNAIVDVPWRYVAVKRGYNLRDFSDVENATSTDVLTDIVRADKKINKNLDVFLETDPQTGETFIVVQDGETRRRVIERLATEDGGKNSALWADLPVRLRDPLDKAAAAVAFISNSTSKEPTLLELFAVLKTLKDAGWTWDQAGVVLKRSRPSLIQNVWPLQYATEALKDLVRRGEFAPGGMAASTLAKKITVATKDAGSEEQKAAAVQLLEKSLLTSAKSAQERHDREAAGDTSTPAKKKAQKESEHAYWVKAYGEPNKANQAACIDAMRSILALTQDQALRGPILGAFAAAKVPTVKPISEAQQAEMAAEAAKKAAEAAIPTQAAPAAPPAEQAAPEAAKAAT